MNLSEAFEYVGNMRPGWKTPKGAWKLQARVHRDKALQVLGHNRNVRTIRKADLASARVALMQLLTFKGKPPAPATVNKTISMVVTVLKELEEQEIIPHAPRLTPLRVNNARTGYFKSEDVEQLIEHSPEELAAAIRFGVLTGCRQKELLALVVEDVDLRDMRLKFRNTKNGTDHILDIHPLLVDLLADRIKGKQANEPVFSFNNADDLRNQFYKVRDQLGFSKELVWHSLRHTTGTWLAERGVPIQTIARVLNHKDLSSTMRYAKTTDKARAAAIHSL